MARFDRKIILINGGARGQDPTQARQFVTRVPLKRQGTADEVVQLVLFLLSKNSTHITDPEISIDGGMSAYGNR